MVDDWVRRAAEAAVRHQVRPEVVTCASGISPSGPVHLGNLREILIPHFVAAELRRMGVPVRHLLSWDDFDRLRKVPAGLPESFAEHLGKPLSKVPDPGGDYASWAERFKQPLRESLARLGVEVLEISQTQMYQAGAYREEILTAIRNRDKINEVLGRYRTKEGSSQATFPYKLYCRDCGRDSTTVHAYDDETTIAEYGCVCGHAGSVNVATEHGAGKLVWKVDWPMRWVYEAVDFEAAGADHSTPGSSFTVGAELARDVFGGAAPSYLGYSFVGVQGMAKMSGSVGRVPTPADALAVLEAPIVRWLYARRKPNQAFTIELGPEVVRLYDEWDALARKERNEAQHSVYERAVADLPSPEVVVPFRILSSVADITAGSTEQIARIVAEVGYPHDSIDQLQPRLGLATTWIERYVDEQDRTNVRATPDTARLADLTETERTWLTLLRDNLRSGMTLDELTTLVYGVPKLARGRSLDSGPTPEVAADQKVFFTLLYQLLVGKGRGPRLPTLILALGIDRVRQLTSVSSRA